MPSNSLEVRDSEHSEDFDNFDLEKKADNGINKDTHKSAISNTLVKDEIKNDREISGCNNLDYNNDGDSNVTQAIKESIDRSIENDSSYNSIDYRELIGLAKELIDEVPIVMGNAGKTVSKIVDIGKDAIGNLNGFANIFISSGKREKNTG